MVNRSPVVGSGALVLGTLLLCPISCANKSTPAAPESTEGQALFVTKDLGPGRCIAMNEGGDVVGIGEDEVPFVANLGSDERTIIGHFRDGDVTVPVGISNTGEVAGYTEGVDGRRVVRHAAGQWSLVAEIQEGGVATSINRQGAISGYVNSTTMGLRGFVSINGAAQELPLPADSSSMVYGVNEAGQSFGIVETQNQETHGFVTRKGTLVDLGTLGGKNSTALGINAAGDVVGAGQDSSGNQRAFAVLSSATTLTPLPVPEGAVATDARGIDDMKRIYGNARQASGAGRPYWYRDGEPVDIMPRDAANVPFYSAQIATVTPEGHVVGWGVPMGAVGGVVHCIVWTPRSAQ